VGAVAKWLERNVWGKVVDWLLGFVSLSNLKLVAATAVVFIPAVGMILWTNLQLAGAALAVSALVLQFVILGRERVRRGSPIHFTAGLDQVDKAVRGNGMQFEIAVRLQLGNPTDQIVSVNNVQCSLVEKLEHGGIANFHSMARWE
jgi:hypothetical protein